MNVLVLGGTGFIGPYVVRQLAAQGHTVTVFHRGSSHADLPAGVVHLHGDRRHIEDCAAQLRDAAPQVALDMFPYTEDAAQRTLQTLRGIVPRVVAISSMDVYQAYGALIGLEPAALTDQPLDEDAPLRSALYPYRASAPGPDDLFYHYDKIPIERLVMNETELRGTVLRLPFVFGMHDPQHRVKEYLPRLEAGEDITLGETQASWRSTRDSVENVAEAIALAVTDERASGRIYNVGAERALTEAEWVRALGDAVDWTGQVGVGEPQPPQEGEASYDWSQHLAADTSRIRRELGYMERVSLAVGIERAIEWEREQL